MLSDAQKEEFIEKGFLHVPSVVPTHLTQRARRVINGSIGKGIDADSLASYTNRSFFPELRDDPRLLKLATNKPTWSLVTSLLGARRVIRPKGATQIALRFPDPEGTPVMRHGWHMDGYPSATNGVPDDGVVRNFNLLLGVMLSDVCSHDSGNLMVWPGMHHGLEQYYRSNPAFPCPDTLPAEQLGFTLPTPHQVMGKCGDVVLVHYQLGHTHSPNLSGDIRYMCFFRLSVRGLAGRRIESLQNIWRDYHGLHGRTH
ncbi:MAG: phytanoyl-CoA dioxygenase family protein [Pseudomonadales bacterium]|nr:phytanoyl-CoA dioxygenase family protein [Pseudomonadales bacterium]